MVRYLIEERSDLRTLVADGTLAVEQEDGRLVSEPHNHDIDDDRLCFLKSNSKSLVGFARRRQPAVGPHCRACQEARRPR
jgi:hypothetical protein